MALCVPCGALWPLPLCPDALHQMNAALYVELLGRHPMFAHLADDALQQAANLLGALKLSRGAKLFRRGERIEYYYRGRSGRAVDVGDLVPTGASIWNHRPNLQII